MNMIAADGEACGTAPSWCFPFHVIRTLYALHGDTAWRLPVPAVFVARPDARIVFAFADVDPARWPDPEELIASLDALRDAHALSKR